MKQFKKYHSRVWAMLLVLVDQGKELELSIYRAGAAAFGLKRKED